MMRRPVCLALLLAALVFPGGAGAADSFLIRGAGYGHGVGLSQYGAYGYALHGQGYATILRHYYRGTTLGREARGTTVRVLLKTGTAAFSGATRAGRERLR